MHCIVDMRPFGCPPYLSCRLRWCFDGRPCEPTRVCYNFFRHAITLCKEDDMSERVLVPSIETRLGALLEINRRKDEDAASRIKANKAHLTVTISREFGCEAYSMAECLKGS